MLGMQSRAIWPNISFFIGTSLFVTNFKPSSLSIFFILDLTDVNSLK